MYTCVDSREIPPTEGFPIHTGDTASSMTYMRGIQNYEVSPQLIYNRQRLDIQLGRYIYHTHEP